MRKVRFVAFPETEYDEVLLGYQPAQMVLLRTRTEMVFETLVFSPLNHLTRLIARENFIMRKVALIKVRAGDGMGGGDLNVVHDKEKWLPSLLLCCPTFREI
jgi:hypothetical protein